MSRSLWLSLLKFTSFGLAGLSIAAHASPEEVAEVGCNLTFENDLFFGSDRHYTNGIQLESKSRWSTDSNEAKDYPVLKRVCWYFGCDGQKLNSTSHKLGQLMYTPENISVGAPQPNDRPWAGMLYYTQENTFLNEDESVLTKLSAQVGAIGPASLAEQTQKFVHKALDAATPRGWGNQVGNELGVLLMVERKTNIESLSGGIQDGIGWRTTRNWRVAGGNIMTFAAAGLEFTLGKGLAKVNDLPGDIGVKYEPPVSQTKSVPEAVVKDIEPSGGATAPVQPPVRSRTCLVSWLECTATASVEARLMAYNAFLDGPMFRGGPSVDSRPLVVDASLAVRFRFPRTASSSAGPWFVQFKATRRSPEFRSSRPVESQSFGALTVGRDFR